MRRIFLPLSLGAGAGQLLPQDGRACAAKRETQPLPPSARLFSLAARLAAASLSLPPPRGHSSHTSSSHLACQLYYLCYSVAIVSQSAGNLHRLEVRGMSTGSAQHRPGRGGQAEAARGNPLRRFLEGAQHLALGIVASHLMGAWPSALHPSAQMQGRFFPRLSPVLGAQGAGEFQRVMLPALLSPSKC